ncbi:MAG: SDR family NAD(P)-dependent oxidoreductase [Fimbriimonadaceae bacterium]
MTKTALIVGASGGIGREISLILAESGYHVGAMARSAEKLEELRATSAGNITAVAGDVFDAADRQRAIETAAPEGSLKALAYCVGSIVLKPLSSLKEDEWIEAFRLNVLGAAQIITDALPALKKAEGASVVLFSTTAAQIGLQNHSLIASVKSAVEGMARSLAADYVGQNIRFNVIAPGLTRTPLAANLLRSPAMEEASAKMHPMGRIAEPREVAETAAFLLTDRCPFMTGGVITVDGGLSTIKPSR